MRGYGRRAQADARADAAREDPFESALEGVQMSLTLPQPKAVLGGLDDMFCAFETQEPLAPPCVDAAQPPPPSSPPTAKRGKAAIAHGTSGADSSPSASMALYDCIAGLVRLPGRSPTHVRARKRALAATPAGLDEWPALRARIVQLLDEQGADPDYHAWECEPLLYHAITLSVRDPDSALRIARILLDRGADALARATDGRSMLDMALDLSDADLVRELLRAGALPTARPLDAFGAPVQRLVDIGHAHAFAHEAQRALDAALADAIAQSDLTLARALLWHGAAPNARAAGRSMLHAALGARQPCLALIELLLRHGADPAPIDAQGGGALWIVALRDDGAALELLLAAGAADACNARDDAMCASVRDYCCAPGDAAPACRAAFARHECGELGPLARGPSDVTRADPGARAPWLERTRQTASFGAKRKQRPAPAVARQQSRATPQECQ
ncbi:hypothetical protein KFE25_013942 [Diacronema lutheri]|uniref:Uncharacterized protein n=1 Tax=Diacronema lutheri TaxID=2081491 RepID=A0A8J5XDQ9_DIALT|nr:hypothetical protein KFE25_013942 [Diacronema lutheri]